MASFVALVVIIAILFGPGWAVAYIILAALLG